jgi:hypothetical protein
LWIVDEFGERRSEVTLDASLREAANLSLNRSMRLQGHLGVLVLADQFFVLDLFQEGSKSFLHGPHQLNEQMAGLEMRDLRESMLAETVAGPNGHPQQVIRDLFNERLGQIAAVTTEMIVFQRDRELVAIETLTGEELWSREIGDPGQLLAADDQVVACRPMGQRIVSTYRLVDGKPIDEFELPEQHYVFAVHGRAFIILERVEPRDDDRQPAAGEFREEQWQLSAYDPLEQKRIWSLPAKDTPLSAVMRSLHGSLKPESRRSFALYVPSRFTSSRSRTPPCPSFSKTWNS